MILWQTNAKMYVYADYSDNLIIPTWLHICVLKFLLWDCLRYLRVSKSHKKLRVWQCYILELYFTFTTENMMLPHVYTY